VAKPTPRNLATSHHGQQPAVSLFALCLQLTAFVVQVMGAITTYVALLMQFQTYGLSFK
jgi:hypothetical protein